MRFRTVLLSGGKTATGIRVPPDVLEALGAGKRPAVRASLNGHVYRSTLGSMAGHVMLPVSAENRAAAGLSAGDEVDVELEVDTAPRVLEVPDDLRAAIDADPAVAAFWDAQSYSNRRRHVLAVEGAKAADTRARRIATAVEKCREGRL